MVGLTVLWSVPIGLSHVSGFLWGSLELSALSMVSNEWWGALSPSLVSNGGTWWWGWLVSGVGALCCLVLGLWLWFSPVSGLWW